MNARKWEPLADYSRIDRRYDFIVTKKSVDRSHQGCKIRNCHWKSVFFLQNKINVQKTSWTQWMYDSFSRHSPPIPISATAVKVTFVKKHPDASVLIILKFASPLSMYCNSAWGSASVLQTHLQHLCTWLCIHDQMNIYKCILIYVYMQDNDVYMFR